MKSENNGCGHFCINVTDEQTDRRLTAIPRFALRPLRGKNQSVGYNAHMVTLFEPPFIKRGVRVCACVSVCLWASVSVF